MPSSEISNHATYLFAREQYLKGLLNAEIITKSQFEKMDRFIYDRLNISEIESYSQSIRTAPHIDIPSSGAEQKSAKGFVSLTDLARQYNRESPGYVIQSWIRDPNTFELLHLWELKNNSDYNEQGYNEIKAGTATSSLTPKRWIEKTGAIGITSKQGQNGGTYAHPVIAGDFLIWLSPKFKLLMLEFQSGFISSGGEINE